MWQNDIHTGRHLTFPVPSLFGHFQPFGQGVHCSWRPCENVPPGQSVAVATVVDGQNFPSGQTVQAWAFPTEYVPKRRKKDRRCEGRFMKETFTVGWVKILHQLTPMYFAYGHLITSRTPYWCPKTWNSGYVGVSNQSCGGWSREWVINICIFVAINTVYPKSFDDMFSVICYVFVRSLLHICQDPPGVCFVTQRRMVTRKPTLEES